MDFLVPPYFSPSSSCLSLKVANGISGVSTLELSQLSTSDLPDGSFTWDNTFIPAVQDAVVITSVSVDPNVKKRDIVYFDLSDVVLESSGNTRLTLALSTSEDDTDLGFIAKFFSSDSPNVNGAPPSILESGCP